MYDRCGVIVTGNVWKVNTSGTLMGKHMGFIVKFKWSIYKVMTQNVTSLNLELPHWDSGDK